MDDLKTFLAAWAVVGYFAVLATRKPKTKRQAFAQLALAGPLGWILFIPISARVLWHRWRGATTTEIG